MKLSTSKFLMGVAEFIISGVAVALAILFACLGIWLGTVLFAIGAISGFCLGVLYIREAKWLAWEELDEEAIAMLQEDTARHENELPKEDEKG